ncbi:SRPBCC domain-containing protein [Taibaiella sp. KBW10]|uniref:SRPBCC family protein n=1 Tax=Taibaiella sp. KBW10 TaxID=2153357 RepID=UPI001315AAA5|nr:SRPBCC domain-containing protein [Taibaiella sp. KBW10]
MNSPIVISEIFKVPAAQIWQALTDKKAMETWYFDIPDFVLEEGAVFNFYEGAQKMFHHQCTIQEIETHKRLKHTWTHPSHSKGVSVVSWTLEDRDGETKVTLVHDGIENFEDAGADFSKENFEYGWDGIIRINLRNYLYHIERLPFTIEINAPKEKVWEALWDKDKYTIWTNPFCEGSYYEGEIEPDGDIRFLAPDGSGMYSSIMYLKEQEQIVFSHIGAVKDGEDLPVDEETQKWTGSLEMYTLTEKDGVTTLIAEVDIDEKHKAFMMKQFPLALQALKTLAES